MNDHGPRRPVRTLCGLAAAGLLLAVSACGYTPGIPASQAAPVGDAAPGPAPTPAPGGLGTAVTPLGTVVTSDGFTLYRFEKDTPKPSKSTCNDTCATSWPPVLGDGLPALQGIPPRSVGTVGRADGSQQLTLNGWPLYRFAQDTAPGEVKGEGVDGTWHAVGVDGKPVATASPPGGSSGGSHVTAPTHGTSPSLGGSGS
ncbi:COG4315 family predicted lipoprotein [Pseudonocardia asaccharolytica]|uniref:Lipoprotein n=1 Tax=Pseudonocardia asaccharolytica DSM 44247 = NBRC 16224 TaxID=1123024 RepID=A0A511D408_9PSEU|nr:hypothetical protein [Pseudonocardia asaccharolytica]GEL19515.1 hypothetical protein PA7_33520 [Pseudonocardia asaccharolytica DSM 44247 = NBRC 16224]